MLCGFLFFNQFFFPKTEKSGVCIMHEVKAISLYIASVSYRRPAATRNEPKLYHSLERRFHYRRSSFGEIMLQVALFCVAGSSAIHNSNSFFCVSSGSKYRFSYAPSCFISDHERRSEARCLPCRRVSLLTIRIEPASIC
jgi:hypothetical protein